MKPYFSRKLLTGIIVGLLGLISGVAATSYGVGADRATIGAKVEEHDKKFVELADLIRENSTSTNLAIQEICKAIHLIQIDLAVLTANFPTNK